MTDSPDNSDPQPGQQNDRHIKKSERLFAQVTPELEHPSAEDIALIPDGPLLGKQPNHNDLSGREIRLIFLISLLAGLLYLALGLVVEKKTGVPLRYTGPGSPHLAFRRKSETTGQTAMIQRQRSAEEPLKLVPELVCVSSPQMNERSGKRSAANQREKRESFGQFAVLAGCSVSGIENISEKISGL